MYVCMSVFVAKNRCTVVDVIFHTDIFKKAKEVSINSLHVNLSIFETLCLILCFNLTFLFS